MKKYFSKLFASHWVATLTISGFLAMGATAVKAQSTGGAARYSLPGLNNSGPVNHQPPSNPSGPSTVGVSTSSLPPLPPALLAFMLQYSQRGLPIPAWAMPYLAGQLGVISLLNPLPSLQRPLKYIGASVAPWSWIKSIKCIKNSGHSTKGCPEVFWSGCWRDQIFGLRWSCALKESSAILHNNDNYGYIPVWKQL